MRISRNLIIACLPQMAGGTVEHVVTGRVADVRMLEWEEERIVPLGSSDQVKVVRHEAMASKEAIGGALPAECLSAMAALRNRASKLIRQPACIVLAGLLVGALPIAARAECQAPKYRKGFVWEDSSLELGMNISIRMSDFAPDRLVCLAQALRQRYQGRKKMLVLFFGSSKAARNCKSPVLGDHFAPVTNWSLQNYGAQLRAHQKTGGPG